MVKERYYQRKRAVRRVSDGSRLMGKMVGRNRRVDEMKSSRDGQGLYCEAV